MTSRTHLVVLVTILMLVNLNPSFSSIPSIEKQATQENYEYHVRIVIVDESDFAAYGFSGQGTSQNPYAIEGLNITGAGSCIWIEEVEVYFVIRNCFLRPGINSPAISMQDCRNGKVTNCWIQDAWRGIALSWSSNMVISDNVIVSGIIGIESSIGFNHSYSGNIIVENSFGCDINDHNSTIVDNRIYANTRNGLTLTGGSYNNTISGNILGWNKGEMILTGGADAIDDGTTNQWSDNSYSQYMGIGNYTISGDASAIDENPTRLADDTAPSLIAPATVSLSSDAPLFNLTFIEKHPLRYNIMVDESITSEGYCFENLTGILLNDLSPGENNMTISLLDAAGNEASFIVRIDVTQDSDELPTIYVLVGVVVVASFIVIMEIFYRNRGSHKMIGG